MMENLDDFIDAKVPANVIAEYYIAYTPDIIKFMIPMAVLLAALFITGRLSSQNELSAIKSTGISLYRMMAPFLAVALIISVLSVFFNGWVVPFANQKKIYIERTYLNRSIMANEKSDILFQEGRRRIVSIRYFDQKTNCARHVSIQDFNENDMTVLQQRYDAQQMQWIQSQENSTQTGNWLLLNGKRRTFSDTSHSLVLFDSLEIGKLVLTPEDIEKKQRTPDEMNYTDLGDFIESQKLAGQNVARWLVEYHFKIAFPFASIIMILFGVPFASSRPRTGAALGLGIALAAAFVYMIFMKASQVFGYNGDLNPLLTAWLANLIFLAAGIINLFRIQK